MAEMSLPKEVNFANPLPFIPEGATATLMSVQSTNGISFSNNQVIQFDLPQQNGLYIIPSSVFIRYKYEAVSGATAAVIRRKPAYTLFTRLEEFIGSVPVNSVYQYNQVANAFIDTNFSAADVMGQYSGFGLTGTPASFSDVDGQTLTASVTNTGYVAAPLVCSALSSLSHYYPTGLSAPWRVQLTVAPVAEIATVSANLTSATIIQPELCFQVINLGASVDALVAQMSPKLRIKANCWANASQSIASSSSGYTTLPFNLRYESITSLYLHSTSSSATKGVNLWGDSFNILGDATTSGSVQFQIGQAMYPQLPLNNTTGGRTAVLQYLRMCNSGSITDQRNTMCIFDDNFAQYANGSTASTANAPAKYIVGIPLAKTVAQNPYSSTALLSGVSAASTPINVLLNIGSSTNTAMNIYLVAEYDAILEIDPMTRQVNVVC